MVLVEFSITAVTEIVIVEFPIFLFTFFLAKKSLLGSTCHNKPGQGCFHQRSTWDGKFFH